MKQSGHTLLWFFSVVITALIVKLFVLDVMYVSGPSMLPSLTHGSLVLEYKLAWGIALPFSNRYLVRWGKPAINDIVIYPWLDRYVIKRCVATEGMSLRYESESGHSVEAGSRLIPLNNTQYHNFYATDTVPEGMFFAVGDNMADSRDSRDYGFVSIDSARGKVLWR